MLTLYVFAAVAGVVVYAVAVKLGRQVRMTTAFAVFLAVSASLTAWVITVGDRAPSDAVTIEASDLPAWVGALIRQPRFKRSEIEAVIYQGRNAFLVMPADRAPDSGNEHILYSEDGRIICEFGGFAGHVTLGSCDMNDIKFNRTLRRTH